MLKLKWLIKKKKDLPLEQILELFKKLFNTVNNHLIMNILKRRKMSRAWT